MIQAERIGKRFAGVWALRDVSLHVARGERWALLGPNGAGKSTLLAILAGLLAPDDGVAQVLGRDVTTANANSRAAIGYLPEGPPLWDDVTPRALMELRGGLAGASGDTLATRMTTLQERLGLGSVLARPCGELSRGQKQRAGLAAVLVTEPRILLLDEPATGLDRASLDALRGVLLEWSADKALVFSTHHLNEAERLATHAMILRNGVVSAAGPIATLKAEGALSAIAVPGEAT